MKSDKGEITIELVITAIILIVIGGVCIFMLTGENGFFVPKKDKQEKQIESQITTNNAVTNELTQEQDATTNENGALTVPVE